MRVWLAVTTPLKHVLLGIMLLFLSTVARLFGAINNTAYQHDMTPIPGVATVASH